MKQTSVTDHMQARNIINAVGDPHQKIALDKLRATTYHNANDEYTEKAYEILGNIEKEYALNTANMLLVDKYDEIPSYIKRENEQ